MNTLEKIVDLLKEKGHSYPEVALHFYEYEQVEKPWNCSAGGCSNVTLGEYAGDYVAFGKTPEAAIEAVLKEIENDNEPYRYGQRATR